MAKTGVEKVGLKLKKRKVYGPVLVDFSVPYQEDTSQTHDFKSVIAIEGGQKEVFEAFYYEKTPDSKKGRAKWVAQPDATVPYSKDDQSGVIADVVEISIDPKFCGTKTMALEAFMSRPTNTYPAKLLVYGTCKKNLVSTTWSTTRGGSALSGPLKFGDHVWLNAQLEGCNGHYLEVELYHKEAGDDPLATTYVAQCISGELNVRLRDTYGWKKYHGWFEGATEEYYAKIKLRGSKTYLRGRTNKLKFKFEVSSRVMLEPETARPLKLGQNEINIERYETCRFKKISFKDEGKTIDLFEEGKLGLKGEKPKEFAISERIHFDTDEHYIRPDAEPILDKLAKFLKDSPFIPVELGAHCDIRKDDQYNLVLSKERAQSSVDYLVRKGVDKDRISAEGYGRSRLLIKGENLSEEEHQQNRRVTIRFKLSGGDAQAMSFNTIAPNRGSKAKKELTLQVKGLESTAHCFKKGTNLEHTTEVSVVDYHGATAYYEGTKDIIKKVYSPKIDKQAYPPFKFIFPDKVMPNVYKYHVHSCRYYIDKTEETIIVKAYNDIKWDFHLFLNLSKSLSVAWQKLGEAKLQEMRQKAGALGAQKRHQQTDIDFGAVLEARWNKISKDNYERKEELSVKFEAKIKQMYSTFAKLKDASKIITGKTKGKAIATVGKKFPLGVEMLPPNLSLGAEWQLARGYKNNSPTTDLGTLFKCYVKAEPILGLELTLDLLQMGITATGPAAPILSAIRYWLQDTKTSNLTVDLYVDLVIFGEIKAGFELQYNTVSDNTDPDRNLTANAKATIGLKIKAGLIIKAKMVVVVAEFYTEAYAKFEGKGSITFGSDLIVNTNSISYRPHLTFDGITATVEIKGTIGLEIKKRWASGRYEKKLTDLKREYKLVESFDIIKSIEELTNKSATIPILNY